MTENTLKKLAQLLEQDQFELIFSEKIQKEDLTSKREVPQGQDIRLVYLMNDAVESFLVFRDARMTGEYHADYEGELEASLNKQGEEFVLVVRQRDTVVTLFFEALDLEVHLYEYAYTGHFWVEGYEYLRQLEYRFAILRDKYDYLGAEYCTDEEKKLAVLTEFPPLNYCCYPAVPEKYIVPRENPWDVSKEAIELMEELAAECGDVSFAKLLSIYRKHPSKFWAKRLAIMLHRTKHRNIADLLTERLRQASARLSETLFWGGCGAEVPEDIGKGKETSGRIRKAGYSCRNHERRTFYHCT